MNYSAQDYIYLSPKSLNEALNLLYDHHKQEQGLRPLAGGTDLMVLLDAGKLKPTSFLSLHQLEELKGITINDDAIHIGALSTFSEIKSNPVIAGEFPMLIEAARVIGAKAIQNRATIGGNLANASPSADSSPALLCYDALCEIQSINGKRLIPYSQFHLDYKKMDLRPQELITGVIIPRNINLQSTPIDFYRKVGSREAQAISKVCFACRLWRKEKASKKEKIIEDIRIGIGGVAPTPLRAKLTENVLKDRPINLETIDQAAEVLSKEITPIDDIRSTAQYRRQITLNLLAYALMS